MKTKKGFIFILDLVLAVIVFFVSLFAILFFFNAGGEITLSEHHLLLIGSDVVTVMDEEKIFDTLDYSTIKNRLIELVPPNYDMLVKVEGSSTVEAGGSLPNKRTIVSGRRAALTDSNEYLKITYYVWVRRP